MEKGLKEYFAKLSKNFWQPGNNLKIKHEKGYNIEPDENDMSWFFKHFEKPKRIEAVNLAFSIDFYNFYHDLLEDEPSMRDFISILPFSYHKLLIKNCADAYDALTIIIRVIENDWSFLELKDYFDRKIN